MSSKCESCRWRAYSERHPETFWARLWRWHTRWCPGWKAYQRELATPAGETSSLPPSKGDGHE